MDGTPATIRHSFAVSGMTCASCSARIERVLSKLEGVSSAEVNLATEEARIEVSEAGPDEARLIKAIEGAGFGAAVLDAEEGAEQSEAAEAQAAARLAFETRRLGLSILLTVPFALDMASMLSGQGHVLPPLVQLALVLPIQFGTGLRFYLPAWAALKAGSGNMDLLVVLGTGAAFLLSLALLLSGEDGHLYFEASAFVITLVLLGKWLETRAKQGTAKALKALAALKPQTAIVRGPDGTEQEVAIASVRLGQKLVVKPGAAVPTDGLVIEGRSEMDEALITGESRPVPKQSGDTVTGGAINATGVLLIEATAVGTETQLARIITIVREAQTGKAPVQRLVDRISAVFVPIVAGLALITGLGWAFGVGLPLPEAIIHGVTVLVIACPCALGLATPAALMAGTGAAARAGILIREVEALEQAGRIDRVIFDKTGTLTEGRPRVSAIFPAIGQSERDLLAMAAGAEKGTEHPLGIAILDRAREQDLEAFPLSDVRALPGLGICATDADGRLVLVGNRDLMENRGFTLDPELLQQVQMEERKGQTAIWVGLDEEETPRGAIILGDNLRKGAALAVQRLRAAGIEPAMLTGDAPETAKAIAEELGLEQVFAGIKPDGKAQVVRDLQAAGHRVAMVGDGINDAPALSLADLGIAMGSGTDVARETAAITLMRSEPELVVDALDVARATRARIRGNLFWAFVYNVIGLPLAAFGFLTPVFAGAAMAMSSVSVVTNALLLARWKSKA
ncbi:MAG: heavy metal translocating P-type ATPase [Magnetovibrionaceae bacterium]